MFHVIRRGSAGGVVHSAGHGWSPLNMALDKTPVYRNLRTRVTFLYLEYEESHCGLTHRAGGVLRGELFRPRAVRDSHKTRFAMGDSGNRGFVASHVQV